MRDSRICGRWDREEGDRMRTGAEEEEDLDDMEEAMSLRESGSNDGGILLTAFENEKLRVERRFIMTNSEKAPK
jgi:hypothetical protein